MTYLDFYINIVFTIKILFLLSTIIYRASSFYNKNKTVIELSGLIRERLELLFKLLMSFFLIYMFYPRRKTPIPLDFEARLLLFIFGFILILSADWNTIWKDSIFFKK